MSKPKEIDDPILSGKQCPYCLGSTSYVDSARVYNGRSYGMIYLCAFCRAYVGVHKGTDIALGRCANAELRELKKKAHAFFDAIYKYRLMNRKKAYKWMAEQLGIKVSHSHIGYFDNDQCKAAIRICKLLFNKNREIDVKAGAPTITPYYEID